MLIISEYKSFQSAILERSLLQPGMRYFWQLFIFYLLVRSKGRLWEGFLVFVCILCTILFNVYFGNFLMTFIDIGEIGCMNMPKLSLDGICSKSGQTNLISCLMCPVGVVLCILGQYWVFPHLVATIAPRHHGMLATGCCRCSTGISVHYSSRAWQSSPRFGGGLSTLVISCPIHLKYVLAILQAAPCG